MDRDVVNWGKEREGAKRVKRERLGKEGKMKRREGDIGDKERWEAKMGEQGKHILFASLLKFIIFPGHCYRCVKFWRRLMLNVRKQTQQYNFVQGIQ